MQIEKFHRVDPGQWDSFVNSHPRSTVYHTSGWMRVLEQSFGYIQKGIVAFRNGKIVGGLPLFQVKGIQKRTLVSSPFRDRGGILWRKGCDPVLLIESGLRICEEHKFDFLILKEVHPLPSAIVEKTKLIDDQYWVRTVVDLSQDVEVIWKSLKNNAKGPVKQAIKMGVQLKIGESIEDIQKFYNMFVETRKQLGVPCFSYRFFKNIWHNLFGSGNVVLFLACLDDIPIAGMLLLVHHNTAIDGYAASMNAYRSYRPNDFLIWEAIKWAKQNKFELFDFGADSPKQKGLLRFKRKWGGIHEKMHHYNYLGHNKEIEHLDSSDGKYDIIKQVLTIVPTPVYMGISKLTVSRFG